MIDVTVKAKQLLEGTDDAPLTIHLASADEIIGALTELVAEVEKLRGALETIRDLASTTSFDPLAGLLDILAVIERAGIKP